MIKSFLSHEAEPARVWGAVIGAISLNIASINAMLTTISLLLAIAYTAKKLFSRKKRDED